MENNKYGNILIIVLLIFLVAYISILKTQQDKIKNEGFHNNDAKNIEKELRGQCDNLKREDILYTRTAVNVPFIDHYPKS